MATEWVPGFTAGREAVAFVCKQYQQNHYHQNYHNDHHQHEVGIHDPRLQMNRYKSSRVVCVLCWDVLLLWGGPQGKSNTSGPPTPHSLHLFQSVLLHACEGSEREHSPHEPKDNNQQDISGFIQMQSLSAGSCIMCTCRDRTHSVICSVRQHVYTPNMPCI